MYSVLGRINHFGTKEIKEVPIILSIQKKEISRSFQTFSPGQTQNVEFQVRSIKNKAVLGRIFLFGDSLSMDNERWFLIHGQKMVNILIIDGDPMPDFRLSETFYLSRVLNPISGEENSITGVTMTLSEFRAKHFHQQ